MVGYWNKPELTAAAIRDGWMHTGDGGYMDDDGYFFVVDRIKAALPRFLKRKRQNVPNCWKS